MYLSTEMRYMTRSRHSKHNLGRKGTDRGSIFRKKSTITNIRTLIQGKPTAPLETELMRNDLVKGVFSSHNRNELPFSMSEALCQTESKCQGKHYLTIFQYRAINFKPPTDALEKYIELRNSDVLQHKPQKVTRSSCHNSNRTSWRALRSEEGTLQCKPSELTELSMSCRSAVHINQIRSQIFTSSRNYS